MDPTYTYKVLLAYLAGLWTAVLLVFLERRRDETRRLSSMNGNGNAEHAVKPLVVHKA